MHACIWIRICFMQMINLFCICFDPNLFLHVLFLTFILGIPFEHSKLGLETWRRCHLLSWTETGFYCSIMSCSRLQYNDGKFVCNEKFQNKSRHVAVAERLPARHWMWNVYRNFVTHIYRNDIFTSFWVSFFLTFILKRTWSSQVI